MSDRTIILVGYGNMGRALCTGWQQQGVVDPSRTYVIEPDDILLSQACGAGFQAFARMEDLPARLAPHFIVFAIKPQLFQQVVPLYRHFAKDAAFISILAGVPIAKFSCLLGQDAAIVRVMPNMPVAIGEGMLAYCDNGHMNSDSRHFVEMLLGAAGVVAQVEEHQMDGVTALSGSGPAYVFYLIECLAKAGAEVGLSPQNALLLARQTVKGAGLLASLADTSPALLRKQVTSPGGTTAAGLEILMREGGMEEMMVKAIKAAHARSIELGS